jgi:hypothetical protein
MPIRSALSGYPFRVDAAVGGADLELIAAEHDQVERVTTSQAIEVDDLELRRSVWRSVGVLAALQSLAREYSTGFVASPDPPGR